MDNGRRRRILRAHRGSSLVIAGDGQPAAVHALAHAMNDALGNVGRTVVYTEPVEARPVDQLQSLRELVDDMNGGAVDLLLIVSGNPVYNAPADLKFADAMGKVRLRVHLSLYEDETSELCHWQIPEAHFLESWSDARAYDGTVSIVQPLIAPLYGGQDRARAAGDDERPPRAIRLRHRPRLLEHAPARGSRLQPRGVGRVDHAAIRRSVAAVAARRRRPQHGVRTEERLGQTDTAGAPGTGAAATGLEIVFRNDPSVLDGRFANNGWLQELPKPITKLTWDNAVLIEPRDRRRV